MRAAVETQLAAQLHPKLVHELLEAHAEAKQNYYFGGLRLSGVEGGRFCEAAFRLLEFVTSGSFTPVGKQIDTERLIDHLRGLPAAAAPDSIRLHIPRALRLVYDIRNKRDLAHLGDGIDPNLQDATLVVSVIDWVLAEFLRLFHNVSADEASVLVDAIVARKAPLIQDFAGFLKVLNPKLKTADYYLVLLYQRGDDGATLEEMTAWARPPMRANIRRTLRDLDNKKDLVHFDGTRYRITHLGKQEVESRKLLIRS